MNGGHALIVALDQRKAFGMVDHRVLFKGMACFGFSPDGVKLIKLIYEGYHINIKINGELSDILSIGRGVRQVFPLSASLYIVYLQIFLNILTGDSPHAVRGICLPGDNQIKVSTYADNLVLFCNDEYDVQKCFSFFNKIAAITGSQLNRDKTEILNLPATRLKVEYHQYLCKEVNICGIIFSDGAYNVMSRINVSSKLENIEKKLDKLK